VAERRCGPGLSPLVWRGGRAAAQQNGRSKPGGHRHLPGITVRTNAPPLVLDRLFHEVQSTVPRIRGVSFVDVIGGWADWPCQNNWRP